MFDLSPATFCTHCFVFILCTLWCATVAPVATVGSVMIAVSLSVCLFALSLSCAFGSAVAPVVSHWPVPEVQFRSQASFLRFVVNKVALGQVLLPVLWFLLSVSLNECFVLTSH